MRYVDGTGYTDASSKVIADPCASYWLKDAISAMDQRDPGDALRDAEYLLSLMDRRCAEAMGTVSR